MCDQAVTVHLRHTASGFDYTLVGHLGNNLAGSPDVRLPTEEALQCVLNCLWVVLLGHVPQLPAAAHRKQHTACAAPATKFKVTGHCCNSVLRRCQRWLGSRLAEHLMLCSAFKQADSGHHKLWNCVCFLPRALPCMIPCLGMRCWSPAGRSRRRCACCV